MFAQPYNAIEIMATNNKCVNVNFGHIVSIPIKDEIEFCV